MKHNYAYEHMSSTFGIYKIEGPNGKLYVGSTSRNFYDRLCAHLCQLRKNKHSSILLQRAWNKYGADAFSFSILEEIVEPAKCIERECYFNDLLKCTDSEFGYNISGVNNSRLGHTQSKETKQKISNALKGTSKPAGFAEHLSKTRRGKDNPQFGKKQSLDLIKRRTEGNKRKVIRSDGRIFTSLKEAASAINVPYQGVSNSLRKGYKCKGFTFKYFYEEVL